VYVASLNFESPALIVPVLRVTHADDRHEWTVGLTGWTLGADWRVAATPRWRRHLFARFTPFNAHSSDYIYVGGRRSTAAQARATSVELGAGAEVRHARGWTGGYRVVATYDSIRELRAPAVADFWTTPFVGVEVTQEYERVTSDDTLGARWNGIKVDGSARLLTGAHTWSRAGARLRGGRRLKRIFVTGELAAFGGHRLNTVSAWLVGGSWDLPAPNLLPGFRYAEFRRTWGTVLGGGMDLRLRGATNVGVRTGYLAAGGPNRYGTAVQLSSVWQGVVINGGVAFPGREEGARRGPAVVFATATAAVFRP